MYIITVKLCSYKTIKPEKKSKVILPQLVIINHFFKLMD